ncbi:MAG: hypothetical protein H6721_11090 [Sandaracinus sp.]|nr:hypothetical protein [Sandaracinus sp.]MCB9632666.1 hypothetical protein [Sandaracinus sp.]
MRIKTLTTLALALGLVGCGAPPVDDFRSEGGTAPDPSGVIAGTVLYQGPRPMCERTEDGTATRLLGRVVMTLFLFDNPPPPSGSATSAANLLTIPAPLLFSSLDDCMPPEGSTEILTRSVEFTWPEIPLGNDYQIRAFYDYDEDFNPFFSVSNLATAGDIGGGALINPSNSALGFRRISFDTAAEQPNGQIVPGIAVALGAPIRTERPAFTFTGTPMRSEETLPYSTDLVVQEQALYDIATAKLSLYSRNPDDPATAALLTAMAEGALSIDTANDVAYAWYVQPVDGDGNGVQDEHPILGRSAGIPWYFPIAIMQRVRSAIEVQANLPTSTLIPSVRPLQVGTKTVWYPDIEIAIPPVAVVQTAADGRCRFPFIAPGNTADRYEARNPMTGRFAVTTECAELPTGYYGINVLQGLAGGRVVGNNTCNPTPGAGEPTVEQQCGTGIPCIMNRCTVVPLVSETSWNILGGTYSSQAWTIPNPLGDPAQVTNFLPEQGVGSLYVVYDETPDNEMGRLSNRAECASAQTAGDNPAVKDIEYADFANFGDDAAEVQEICCAGVRHLCGLPLCGLVPANPDAPDGPQVRSSPTSIEGIVPDCVPFEMPAFCCQTE